MSTDREELVGRVLHAGRLLSTAAVMFHTALSGRRGLSATEFKALELLDRLGPMTPSDLSARSGLAPPSITGLLDRLEHKGFVRRQRHPQDGRRLLVDLVRERLADEQGVFEPFVRSLVDLCARYDDDQLETIASFLTESAERQQEATAELTRET